MKHAAGTELLDDPAADPAAVRRSLRNIARANRLFGGTAAVRYGVTRLLAGRRKGPCSLLDLGTGAGDIPRDLRGWAGRRGYALQTFGLERLRPAALLARDAALPVAVGCASSLPFRDRSVDIVLASQVLHHFDREQAVGILREAARVARLAVVVADLQRSRTAALLFDIGARLLSFDVHTRTDGITSVRRGYREGELLDLFAAADLESCSTSRPGWRVVAWEVRA